MFDVYWIFFYYLVGYNGRVEQENICVFEDYCVVVDIGIGVIEYVVYVIDIVDNQFLVDDCVFDCEGCVVE